MSLPKYSPWQLYKAQRFCHWCKHIWNSRFIIALSMHTGHFDKFPLNLSFALQFHVTREPAGSEARWQTKPFSSSPWITEQIGLCEQMTCHAERTNFHCHSSEFYFNICFPWVFTLCKSKHTHYTTWYKNPDGHHLSDTHCQIPQPYISLFL